jgi:hypothetical protein
MFRPIATLAAPLLIISRTRADSSPVSASGAPSAPLRAIVSTMRRTRSTEPIGPSVTEWSIGTRNRPSPRHNRRIRTLLPIPVSVTNPMAKRSHPRGGKRKQTKPRRSSRLPRMPRPFARNQCRPRQGWPNVRQFFARPDSENPAGVGESRRGRAIS